ncbi:hypothetical protein PCE1_001449 [Barthelona sp. PCE]
MMPHRKNGYSDGLRTRTRITFTEAQLQTLRGFFNIESHPSSRNPNEYKRIAKQTNLPEKTVRIWFQNQRARQKRSRTGNGEGSQTSKSAEYFNNPQTSNHFQMYQMYMYQMMLQQQMMQQQLQSQNADDPEVQAQLQQQQQQQMAAWQQMQMMYPQMTGTEQDAAVIAAAAGVDSSAGIATGVTTDSTITSDIPMNPLVETQVSKHEQPIQHEPKLDFIVSANPLQEPHNQQQ